LGVNWADDFHEFAVERRFFYFDFLILIDFLF
jgi:hypothetical protein